MLPPFLFNDIVRKEITKINKFAEDKYNDIINNLLNMYKLLKSLEYCNMNISTSSSYYYKYRVDLERQLDLIGCDIIHFDFYIRRNSKTIMKLGFYFDRVMNISINQWLLLSLIKEKFCNIDVDSLIVYLSYLYTLLRSLKEDSNTQEESKSNEKRQSKKVEQKKNTDDKSKKWKPPDTFQRTSTKFLMKYDDIVYTKVKIVKHLPYLIFDFSNEDLENHFKFLLKYRKWVSCEKNWEEAFVNAKEEEQKERKEKDIEKESLIKIKPFSESQQITSVYFDNQNATCYLHRILRYENAQLIRFRWYNENDGNPEKPIYIERKIHHEEWTGELSTKERFELEQKYISKYMSGQLNIKEFFLKKLNRKRKELLKGSKKIDNDIRKTLQSEEDRTMKNISLACAIQKKILREDLSPIIRTSYLRSAFQLSDNNLVRISIDTNISLLNEYVLKRKNWCKLAEEALGKNEVMRLNYGIIEVKLKVDKMPEWISTILNTNNSINVYKYSKYQTAMALLHSEKLQYIPIWIHNNLQDQFNSSPHMYSSLTKMGHDPIPNGSHNEMIVIHKGNKSPESSHSMQNKNQRGNERNRERKSPSFSTSVFQEKESTYYGPIVSQTSSLNTHQMNYAHYSNFNTLQKWNLLDKTYLWINKKYEPNLNYKEKYAENMNLLKIDPKVNFAAERSFLHYVLLSVYINLLALFLEKYKNYDQSLNLIIFVLLAASFSLLISSYFIYLRRIDIIKRRKTREALQGRSRFDSFYAPVISLFFMMVAVILSFIFNYKLKTKKIA